MAFPYPAVLFDLDGTLVDSAADIAEAVNRTLADHQLPRFDEATIRGWIGEGARKLIETAFAAAGSPADIDRVMPGFMVHYGDCLLLHARVYPGVAETLAALHAQGVKLAVCTNKPQRHVAPLLQAMGLDGWIDAVVGGDTLAERKPSALPLQYLAAHFGVATGDCLMVGDSQTDADAAMAAGMPLVLVAYGYRRGFDLHGAGARVVTNDLRDLLVPGAL